MGLMVTTIANMPYADRRLYIYLLDYGWPNGPYEKIFKENFPELARRASDTYSVVVMSDRGVHFANEVFSWHEINGVEASNILPAILLTDAHPNYFVDSNDGVKGQAKLDRMALISLKRCCTSPDEFTSVVSTIFEDLANDLKLRDFRAVNNDELILNKKVSAAKLGKRVIDAVMLQPNIGGVGVDLKRLFASKTS